MVIDNKYEVIFKLKLTKKIIHIFIHLPKSLKNKLGKGIENQILANLHGYVDDNIPLF